jgi:hypothetical protein
MQQVNRLFLAVSTNDIGRVAVLRFSRPSVFEVGES